MLLDFLIKNFEPGEPIFTSDAECLGLSSVNLRQQLKKLCDARLLLRFDAGVFFLPDPNGAYYPRPSANKVAEYKYISNEHDVYGYYSGYTFANQLGLTLQVPYKAEIVSNNVAATVREVKVGQTPFFVRRSRIAVTRENVSTLQLLDLLKDVEEYTDYECEAEAPDRIKGFIQRAGIRRSDIDRYIGEFPLKTYKSIYDMRLESVLA